MAHQTGTADNFPALLDALCTFLTAQGWTVNSNAVEGAGRRAHVSKGAVFANFRALANEYRYGVGSANSAAAPFGTDYQHYGLSMNLGTSFNGISGTFPSGAWDQQPGVPQNSASKYLSCEMRGPLGMTGNVYHFYAHTSPDFFLVELEDKANPGLGQFLSAGVLDKTGAGTYTGGEWFSGSGNCQATAFKNGLVGQSSDTAAQNFYVRVAFTATAPSTDSFTGWLGWDGASGATYTGKGAVSSIANFRAAPGAIDASGVPNFFMQWVFAVGQHFRRGLPYLGLSQVSVVQTLLDYHLFMNRGLLGGRKGYSYLGRIPKVFGCSLMNLAAADTITIGGDIYQAFPSNIKGEPTSGTINGTGANGVTWYKSDDLGYAVKQ